MEAATNLQVAPAQLREQVLVLHVLFADAACPAVELGFQAFVALVEIFVVHSRLRVQCVDFFEFCHSLLQQLCRLALPLPRTLVTLILFDVLFLEIFRLHRNFLNLLLHTTYILVLFHSQFLILSLASSELRLQISNLLQQIRFQLDPVQSQTLVLNGQYFDGELSILQVLWLLILRASDADIVL